jgi:hypothetical protein
VSQNCSAWLIGGSPRTISSLPIFSSDLKFAWPSHSCQCQASSS